MFTVQTSCEPPAHSIWHLVSGVAALAVLWAAGVIAFHWLMR
jgi:hypothetical protein